MINLAFYATGHGYGHFTRLMAVAGAFKTYPDVAIHVRSPFTFEKTVDALGFEPDSWKNIRLDLGLAQLDSLHHNLDKTIRELEWYFGPEGDKLIQQEADEIKQLGIDAAILDTPPRAFDACRLAGIPAFASASFGWDDIWRSFLDVEPRFEKFINLASASYRKASLLLRTEMHLGLEAFNSERIDVPLIGRTSCKTPGEMKRVLGLPDNKPVVLIGFGGEGLKGMALPDRQLLDKFVFLASEPMENPGEGFYYITGKEIADHNLRYFDLVKLADIAMVKPGYSMVAECIANRTAVLYTPRTEFVEAETVTPYMEANLPSEVISFSDLIDGNWEVSLNRLANRMPFDFKDVPVNGAEVIAREVMKRL